MTTPDMDYVERTMERRRLATWPTVEAWLAPEIERRGYGLEPSGIRCPLPAAFFRHATDEEYEKVRAALARTFVREVKKMWEASERRGIEAARARAEGIGGDRDG